MGSESVEFTAKYVQPYLFFGGRCEEALQFYTSTIGAEVEMVMRYNESPEQPPAGMLAPGFENKVMHSAFKVGATTVMASDGCDETRDFKGFSLSITLENDAEAKRVFALLADGGSVQMPITKTFWSPCFGMLTDKFGIGWMVTVPMR